MGKDGIEIAGKSFFLFFNFLIHEITIAINISLISDKY